MHSVVHTYDSLTNVVQLVGSRNLSVVAYFLEEGRICVERTGQLMGVSFVKIVQAVVVPLQCTVAVEGVPSAQSYAVEEGIFPDEPAYLLH